MQPFNYSDYTDVMTPELPWGRSTGEAERAWFGPERPDDHRLLPTVRNEQVHPRDTRRFDLRPSPRMIDLVERLASLLHPPAATNEGVER